MRYALLTVTLSLAACASDEPDVVLDGVDPVQTDDDLAPDALDAPGGTLEPDATLQPSASEPMRP